MAHSVRMTAQQLLDYEKFDSFVLGYYLGIDPNEANQRGLELLEAVGVLPTRGAQLPCPRCPGLIMSTKTDRNRGLGWRLHCRNCNSKKEPTVNTFVEGFRARELGFGMIPKLILCWIKGITQQQRRRSSEDEQMMRKYLCEGDLISAEVQSIFSDGSLSLHTRSLKYGKLSQGVLVKVFPGLIKRRKTHFHKLPCGASVILGNNGYIWICPTTSDEQGTGGFIQNLDQPVPRSDREVIARLRNCILALATSKMLLFDTSICYAFEQSLKYEVEELLVPEHMLDVAVLTQACLQMQESVL